jgi:hypothetical protein
VFFFIYGTGPFLYPCFFIYGTGPFCTLHLFLLIKRQAPVMYPIIKREGCRHMPVPYIKKQGYKKGPVPYIKKNTVLLYMGRDPFRTLHLFY